MDPAGDLRTKARYAVVMTQWFPAVSRRRAMGLLALALLPRPLHATGTAPTDPEARLRRALAEMRLPFPARLDLIGFSRDAPGGRVCMAATVRMTWAPGMRQRRFATERDDPERALAALLDEVRSRFSAAA